MVRILESVNQNEQSVLTDLRLSNQCQSVLGVKTEQLILKEIMRNARLIHFSLYLDTPDARVRVRDHIKKNLDRTTRQARKEELNR